MDLLVFLAPLLHQDGEIVPHTKIAIVSLLQVTPTFHPIDPTSMTKKLRDSCVSQSLFFFMSLTNTKKVSLIQ